MWCDHCAHVHHDGNAQTMYCPALVEVYFHLMKEEDLVFLLIKEKHYFANFSKHHHNSVRQTAGICPYAAQSLPVSTATGAACVSSLSPSTSSLYLYKDLTKFCWNIFTGACFFNSFGHLLLSEVVVTKKNNYVLQSLLHINMPTNFWQITQVPHTPRKKVLPAAFATRTIFVTQPCQQ